MAEISRPWAGTTIGDAGPYTAPNWWDVWQAMMGSNGALIGAGNKGIFPAIGDAFVLTYPGPNFLTVGTGAAMVDGLFYRNDAAKSVTVTSATAGNVRDDRLVIRKYFAADNQTARIVLLPGSEVASPGPGTPPALTQDVNRLTYWDIPLSRVSIADTGVITLTDEREFIPTATPGLVLLEEIEVTEAAGATITFDNIPQQYADLIISWAARPTSYGPITGVGFKAIFNDDTNASHYADVYEWYTNDALTLGTSHPPGTVAGVGLGPMPIATTAAQFRGEGLFEIVDYAGSYVHTLRGEGRMFLMATSAISFLQRCGTWLPAAGTPINKIYLETDYNVGSGDYNFAQGSVFRLYARTR